MVQRPHRRFLLKSAAASAAFAAGPAFADTDWHALTADVKAEMAWGWRNYKDRAWGHDQIKPVSGGHEAFLFQDRLLVGRADEILLPDLLRHVPVRLPEQLPVHGGQSAVGVPAALGVHASTYSVRSTILI